MNFTGISAPYDEPVDAELVVDTDKLSILDGVELVSALERNH